MQNNVEIGMDGNLLHLGLNLDKLNMDQLSEINTILDEVKMELLRRHQEKFKKQCLT
jgi:hypothetical protein